MRASIDIDVSGLTAALHTMTERALLMLDLVMLAWAAHNYEDAPRRPRPWKDPAPPPKPNVWPDEDIEA